MSHAPALPPGIAGHRRCGGPGRPVAFCQWSRRMRHRRAAERPRGAAGLRRNPFVDMEPAGLVACSAEGNGVCSNKGPSELDPRRRFALRPFLNGRSKPARDDPAPRGTVGGVAPLDSQPGRPRHAAGRRAAGGAMSARVFAPAFVRRGDALISAATGRVLADVATVACAGERATPATSSARPQDLTGEGGDEAPRSGGNRPDSLPAATTEEEAH